MFGSICWWCHWGWPKAVAEIYRRAQKDIDALLDGWPKAENDWTYPGWPSCGETALEFGPGHVVWSDENWDCAPACLRDFDRNIAALECPPAIAAVIWRSLEELAALPESAWNVEPADYDGANPQNYPPAPGVEMVPRP